MKRERIKQELEPKDLVRLDYDIEAQGILMYHGPEQSEVKFAHGVWRTIPNKHLEIIRKGGREA